MPAGTNDDQSIEARLRGGVPLQSAREYLFWLVYVVNCASYSLFCLVAVTRDPQHRLLSHFQPRALLLFYSYHYSTRTPAPSDMPDATTTQAHSVNPANAVDGGATEGQGNEAQPAAREVHARVGLW